MTRDCILVIAYNRPDYTRQLLTSLAAQPSIKNYHVHFQIDPGNAEVQEMCKKFDATESTVLVNQFRLDCNMNVYAGLKNAFAIADFVMVFEDDCIPAHDCLEWMEWAKTNMDWDSWAINAFHRHEEKDPDKMNLSFRCPHWTAWVWGTSKEHWLKLDQVFKEHVPEDSSDSWDRVLFDKYFRHGTVIKPYLSRARNIGAENGRYNPSIEFHKENMWIDIWSDSVKDQVDILNFKLHELDNQYKKDLRCFCGGYYNYAPFEGYLVCRDCGTYHSPNHANPKEYYDAKYWSAEKGNSTPIEQWYNLTSSWFKGLKPRVDFWMDMIGNILPGSSIEIGPGPGTFMQRMMNYGWRVSGIDADQHIVNCAQDLSKVPMEEFVVGFWPQQAAQFPGTYDMIVCTDVFEHTPDPKGFLEAIHEKLEYDGYAFIQTPVILEGRDTNLPFGELTQNLFEPKQHIYLYTINGFKHLIKDLFDIVDQQVWYEGHECFLLKKK